MFWNNKASNIKPGMICILDSTNTLKLDTGAPETVTVEEFITSGKGKGKWKVSYLADGKKYNLYVAEKLLTPYMTYVTRNPPDMPIFNDLDLRAINIAINNATDQTLKNRLSIIKEKITIATSLREV